MKRIIAATSLAVAAVLGLTAFSHGDPPPEVLTQDDFKPSSKAPSKETHIAIIDPKMVRSMTAPDLCPGADIGTSGAAICTEVTNTTNKPAKAILGYVVYGGTLSALATTTSETSEAIQPGKTMQVRAKFVAGEPLQQYDGQLLAFAAFGPA